MTINIHDLARAWVLCRYSKMTLSREAQHNKLIIVYERLTNDRVQMLRLTPVFLISSDIFREVYYYDGTVYDNKRARRSDGGVVQTVRTGYGV